MQARGLLNYRLKYCWPKVIYCICHPNELEREITKKLGVQAKIWGGMAHPDLPLRISTGHELSLPSLRRTVLFLTRSGMRFRHCSSLILLGIAKTVANASAQHDFIPFKYIL